MSVNFRAVNSTTGIDATAEGSIDASVQDGDIMVAFLTHSLSAAVISATPSGWTSLIADPNPADFSCVCYRKIKASGDSSTPTWTWDQAGNWTVDLIAYSGEDQTTPINASGGNQIAAANTITTPSLTPSVDNTMMAAFGAVDATGGARTWTESGAMTERVEALSNQIHRVVAEELIPTGGSATTRNLTVSGSAQDIGSFAVFIAPGAVVDDLATKLIQLGGASGLTPGMLQVSGG